MSILISLNTIFQFEIKMVEKTEEKDARAFSDFNNKTAVSSVLSYSRRIFARFQATGDT